MIDFKMPQRIWINQPSILQEDHALHGKRGIAVMEKYDTPDCPFITVYFTEGKVVSQRMSKMSLSLAVDEGGSNA